MNSPSYAAKYSNSHALVIGIDKYANVSPLNYAVSDARGIAETLISKLNFSSERITSLLDENATKEHILAAYFKFVQGTSPDDRVIIFFAGHGHTRPGRLRDVGFLVPVDGQLDNLASLIRWDDLTKNAELIPAKHMLYLMDACYGGLALTRSAPAGSLRFMTDMLRRYGRQVITAGKANEEVADSGGPLPDHSLFTGHLMEALGGKASTPDGFLTGSSVMAYVYERVGKAPESQQTPHYGFLEGDGDIIFSGLPTKTDTSTETEEELLVALPQPSASLPADSLYELTHKTKSFLADSRSTIVLHDLAMVEAQRFLTESTDDYFKTDAKWTDDEFRSRVKRYEEISSRLCVLGTCIAHWGNSDHNRTLQKTILRMADRLQPMSSTPGWADLNWYPVLLFAYSAGIAAIAGDNFGSISAIMNSKVHGNWGLEKPSSMAFALAKIKVGLAVWFKKFPGHERNHFPLSEYLLKFLQPKIDDVIFSGRQYEEFFDRFEVILSLSSAAELFEYAGFMLGLGRYAYKYKQGSGGGNPLADVLTEARSMKESWPPLKSGLLNSSYGHFEEIAVKIENAAKTQRWF